MKKIFLFLFLLVSFTSFGEDTYLHGKIISGEVLENSAEQLEGIKEIIIYEVKTLSGDNEGDTLSLEYPIYVDDQFNVHMKVGDKVVLAYENDMDGLEKYYIVDRDKRVEYVYIILIFVIFTYVIAKFRGIKSLLALLITIIFITKVFIPGIVLGYSPILLSVMTGFFSSFITIYLITGFNNKGLVAIIGSIAGVTFAGLLSYIFVNRMGLSGYESFDSLNFADMLKVVKIKELISAGVIIGSMGAVMDVSMSISSALNEIAIKNENITSKEIFNSGIEIGKDIIGTMINTLILAYIGSSLLTIVMIYMQIDHFPMVRILNFENISIEILRSFCGSLGIIVTAPLTSLLSAKFYIKKTKKK